MFIRPKITQDTFDIIYNGKNYTINRKHNKYYITINNREYDISTFVDANGDFLTQQVQTFIDAIASLTKPTRIRYYIEILDDTDEVCINSKWFDTEEEAVNFYENMIAYVRFRHTVYLMCAEFDEDYYGDIETVRELR